jgi:signal transduction histidine kinase
MEEKRTQVKVFANKKVVSRKTFLLFIVFILLVFVTFTVDVISRIVIKIFSIESGLIWIIPITSGVFLMVTVVILWGILKRVEKLKSEFITIAAHRLRTPLTRAQWMLQELLSEAGMIEGSKTASSLKETLDNLTMATNRLLDAAEAGKVSLYFDYIFEKGRIEYIVRQIVADYTIGAMRKDIGLSVDIEENLPEVYIDKERMKVAVSAFIENAIIYTPVKGTIEIKVYKEKRSVFFSVKDSGIGISKEALHYIFSKFFRTKEAVSLDRDRAGLGLFITKEIIERHKGKVGVDSEGKDRGSRFWFSLPAIL